MTLKPLRTLEVFGTLLLAAIVPPSKALAQTTGALTGVVLERATGQPIAAAEIRVDTTTLVTSTNAIGRFHLEGVPVGRATIVVHAPGFLDVRLADVLVSAATATPVSAELVATPNFLDRVQVT